jgi:hypothetical protein
VERAQLAVTVAGDEDRTSSHLGEYDLPGLLDLVGGADRNPAAGEDPLPLKAEKLRRRVGIRDQGEGKLHRQACVPVGRLVSERLGR